jgi:hypothetical protein
MANRKKMPKQAFSGKLENGEKIQQQDRLLAIKWKHVRDVSFLTIAHEDVKMYLLRHHCQWGHQWRTERGVVWGFQHPPFRNSEVLSKLNRIPSSVENTSITV